MGTVTRDCLLEQALMIAFIDDFHLMMIVSLAAIPLLLLLKKGRRVASRH